MLHRNKKKKIMPDVWMAPGGKREFNEGLFECARREILEETGLTIKNLEIKATGNAYLKDVNLELYFHFLVADYAGGRVSVQKEDGELAWMTPNKISRQTNLLAELREVLPYVLSNKERVISYKAVYEKGNHMIAFQLEDSV